jgi:hypothetical protein
MKRYLEVLVLWLLPVLVLAFGAVLAIEWLIAKVQP